MADRSFHAIHAQAVQSDDGVEIEFLDLHRLAFRVPNRSIVLPAETFIARDGAPDGVVVRFDGVTEWSDGALFTDDDARNVWQALQQASGPLRTAFHLPRPPR